MAFHCLMAHLFSMQNNNPLYGYARVCLSIHVLKDIFAASSFADDE